MSPTNDQLGIIDSACKFIALRTNRWPDHAAKPGLLKLRKLHTLQLRSVVHRLGFPGAALPEAVDTLCAEENRHEY
jgi:hypothetical protein